MVHPKYSGAGAWRAALTGLCLAGLALGLAACHPDARSDSVAAEKGRAVLRSDRFQAVVRSGDRLVAVGAYGAILVSSDNGAHWSRTELPGAPPLLRVAACGDGRLVALDFSGQVWLAGADAATWEAFRVPAADAVLDATCTADNRIWVVGARGAIFASGDGGRSWADRSLAEDLQFLNVQFPTASFGVISGEFGRVLVSRDSGATWGEGGSTGAEFYPQGMHFADERRGLVVGLGGAVQETQDGGLTWTRSKAPTEAPLYGVAALPGDGVVAVGAAGSAFRRTAGTWQAIEGVPLTDLRGIAATPTSVVLAGAGALVALPTATLAAKTN
jgi:photosystem II stability/assembly factor-like uncharacterized protein